jgi:hypothetical protein
LVSTHAFILEGNAPRLQVYQKIQIQAHKPLPPLHVLNGRGPRVCVDVIGMVPVDILGLRFRAYGQAKLTQIFTEGLLHGSPNLKYFGT